MEIFSDNSTANPEFLKADIVFPITEYIFFAAVLIGSLGIGIFYGFCKKANKTTQDFVTAGRSMPILPVALSLICSFVSAITLLSNPVENYLYGMSEMMMALCIIPMTLALIFIYVPVYFRLQLTSAYEYFEWRFSRKIRMLISGIAIFHLMCYMPTVVYAPSLALEQVAGIHLIGSCTAIFLVCIAYSSLGGLKAVLWTDALQAAVMLISLVAIIAAGMVEVGGFTPMWRKARLTHRTIIFNADFDLRTRRSFWADVIGGYFAWLPIFAATQSQIQRYNSVPTLSQSRKTLVFNMLGLIAIIVLCSWIGLILHAHYFGCDPIKSETVKSSDQLLPLFVIQVLAKFPGLPGIMLAGLTCGSLSSISSALNSLTSLITEDFIRISRPDLTEQRLITLSKIISAVIGIIALFLVFLVAEVNQTVPIIAFGTLIHGTLLGPILGAFSLGMFLPWAEEIGMLIGFIVSLVLTSFIGVGSILAGRAGNLPDERLSLLTGECPVTISSNQYFSYNGSVEYVKPGDWKAAHVNDPLLTKIFSMSYMWQPLIAPVLTFALGGLISLIIAIVRKRTLKKVNESLLSQPILKLWSGMLGTQRIQEWVDFESPGYSGDPVKKQLRAQTMKLQ